MVTILKVLCVINILMNVVLLGISIGEGDFDGARLSATLGWSVALLNIGVRDEN